MARLPYLDADDLPEDQRDVLARPINLFRLLAHSPDAARSFNTVGQWIRYRSRLDPRLREIAILTVGYLARAPYEYSHHVKIGQDFGLSKQDIRSTAKYLDGRSATELTEVDRLVIDCARQISDTHAVEDATYASLEEILSSEELVDLFATVAFYNCVVRFLGAFQIDVEAEYQPYLDEFPLPEDVPARDQRT